MEKTIVVPTDFSENADSALGFALGLASKHGFGIHLVHAFLPQTSSQANQHFNQKVSDHAEIEAEHKLTQLFEKIKKDFPDLSLTMDCVNGLVADVLQQLAGKASHQLIVMGTKGATGLKQVFLGSNTYNTIQKSPIPVWAIPPHITTYDVKKAGLLSNFKKSDLHLLEIFMPIVAHTPTITLLHVQENKNAQDKKAIDAWTADLKSKTGIEAIDWKTETTISRLDIQDDIPASIADLAHKNNIDTLLITYTPKTFFNRLFSRNLAKSMAHRIDVPVFFYKD